MLKVIRLFYPCSKEDSNEVICLISALAYHEMTTQIPHVIYVALPRRSRKPTIEYPPMRFFWYLRTHPKEHILEQDFKRLLINLASH